MKKGNIMIYDRCVHCHRRMLAGTKCECRKKEKRIYGKKNSGDKVVAFYNSKRWQTVREIAKTRYQGIDIYSLYILKKIEQAETVHHINPIKDAWEKRYCLDNLIPLTNENHRLIHGKMKDGENVGPFLMQLKARYEEEFLRAE